MSALQTTWVYLERDPLSSYQLLSIKGRRIRARTLYGAYKNAEDPLSPEQIAQDYDLPLEAVKEAIAYCESDPAEIRLDQELENVIAEVTGLNAPEYRMSPATHYRRVSAAELLRLTEKS
jgi:uncharacterized protein (DUF433 family)